MDRSSQHDLQVSLQLIALRRLVGPYEEWLGELPEDRAEDLPALVTARRPHPSRRDQGPLNARLRRAGQIARRIAHPGALQCYGELITETLTAQILERFDAVDLQSLIRHGTQRIPLPLICWLGRELAHAVGHAHSLEIAHRQISPEQILVGRDGTVKVDFALTSAFVDEPPAADADPQRALTDWIDIRYAHLPALTDPGLSKRGDVFSLGAVIWELATNVGYQDALRKAAEEEPGYLSARTVDAAVPDGLDAILERAISDDTFDAEQLATALTRVFFQLDGDSAQAAQALSDWVRDSAPREDPVEAERRETDEDEPDPRSAVLRPRSAWVRPRDLRTEDVRSALIDPPEDGSWAPGLHLKDALKRAKAEAKATRAVRSPEHPVAGPADHADAPRVALTPTPTPSALAAVPRPSGSISVPEMAKSEPELEVSGGIKFQWLWFLAGFAITVSLLLFIRGL